MDQLKFDYINSLGQIWVEFGGGYYWPVHDIEVECALVRIDVCGLLEVKRFSEVVGVRDESGNQIDPDSFWCEEEEECQS